MKLSHLELSQDQLDALGAELDALEARTRAEVGEVDALYIRKMIKVARQLDAAGRVLLMGSLFPPAWLAGTTLLSIAKILDNMEIGHNVMHGQYDFMNDPVINTNYEWDNVSDGESWRHSHNYVHHTYTNVLGVDHDIGYRAVRLSEEQPWHPRWLGNLGNMFGLATLFEWGVGVHDTNLADAAFEKNFARLELDKVMPLVKKATRQIIKDYVMFPMLAGPMFAPVLAGNAIANVVRNYWSWAVIFCGHFPEGTTVFTQESLVNETRGQWYMRQMAGSANIDGGKLMHIMTGHLSHQIEHHLFPTIPAWRYPEMAKEVQKIAEKYGVPYNHGTFGRQIGSVIKQIARMSLPVSVDDALNWRKNNEAMIHAKEEGMKVIRGEKRPGENPVPPPMAKSAQSQPTAIGRVVKALRKSSAFRTRKAA